MWARRSRLGLRHQAGQALPLFRSSAAHPAARFAARQSPSAGACITATLPSPCFLWSSACRPGDAGSVWRKVQQPARARHQPRRLPPLHTDAAVQVSARADWCRLRRDRQMEGAFRAQRSTRSRSMLTTACCVVLPRAAPIACTPPCVLAARRRRRARTRGTCCSPSPADHRRPPCHTHTVQDPRHGGEVLCRRGGRVCDAQGEAFSVAPHPRGRFARSGGSCWGGCARSLLVCRIAVSEGQLCGVLGVAAPMGRACVPCARQHKFRLPSPHLPCYAQQKSRTTAAAAPVSPMVCRPSL